MIDLSNAARDVIEIIEATEEAERKRAAEIVLKNVIELSGSPEWFNIHRVNIILREIAKQIMDGE